MYRTVHDLSRVSPLKQNLKNSVKSLSDYFSTQNSHIDGETTVFRKSAQKTQVIQKISLTHEELSSFMEVSQWRAKNSQLIIPINKVIIVSDPQRESEVLVRSFRDTYSLRIKDIELLSFCDLVSMLESVICGFKLLEEQFGSFTITEDMIAIDKKNVFRVWCNEKFSQHRPNSNYQGWQINKCKLLNTFKNICLSTVLALQFFNHLKVATSFKDLLQLISSFKKDNGLESFDQKLSPVMKILQTSQLHFSGKQKKRLKGSQNLMCSQKDFQLTRQNSMKKLEHSVEIRMKNSNKDSLASNSTGDQPTFDFKKLGREIGSVSSSNSSLCSQFNISLKTSLKKPNITLNNQVYNHTISPIGENTDKFCKVEKPKVTLDSFCRVVDENQESSFLSEDNLHSEYDQTPRKKINTEDHEEVVQIRKQCEKIIEQNGWSKKLLGLLDKDPIVEESVNEGGAEVNSYLINVKLNKLDKLGTSITSNPESQSSNE